MSEFQGFQRKTFSVQAARVTPLNIEELAKACGGTIKHDGDKEGQFSRDYIKVRVQYPINERQTEAHVGDWLVKQGKNFKVYQDKPFRNTFELPDGTPVPRTQPELPKAEQGGTTAEFVQKSPSPAQMPKKLAEPSIAEEQAAAAAAYEAAEKAVITPETVEVPIVNPTTEEIQEAASHIDTSDFVEVAEGPGNAEVEPDETSAAVVEETVETTEEVAPEAVTEEAPQEEKRSITLDELNTLPGDPRSAQEIMGENRQ